MIYLFSLRPMASPIGDPTNQPTLAAPILLMRHPATGESVQVPIGYSWQVLLFGPVALALRREWRLALVCLLLPLVGQVLLAGTANRIYLNQLLRRGFRAVRTQRGYVSQIEWQLCMQLPRYAGRSSKSAD